MYSRGGIGSLRYVLVTSRVGLKWWSSITVVEIVFPFGLGMCAL